MNPKARKPDRAAFCKMELLAIVAVVVLLVVVSWPTFGRYGGYRISTRTQCVNHLKKVGLAFRIFATDNGDLFPAGLMVSNGVEITSIDILSVYKSLTNELSTPELLHCPEDKTRKAAENFTDFTPEDISYFVNLSADETRPQDFLAGDRNLQTNGIALKPGLFALYSGAKLGWTKEIHNGQGNIALGDGSVQQMSTSRLTAAVTEQQSKTNYLVIP